MSTTVAEYWDQHQVHSLKSLEIAPVIGEIDVVQDPDGQHGWIDVAAHSSIGSILEIWEDIEVVDSTPHRRKYSCHFMPSGDRESVRFDYDPILDDPDMQYHVNRPNGVHEPDEWRALKDVIHMCWAIDGDPSLSGADIP